MRKGKSKGKSKKGHVGSGKGNKRSEPDEQRQVLNCGKTGHYASGCREKWSGNKGSGKSKGGKGKFGKGKGKLNSVGKKDGWKQERHIANTVKSMPMVE